MLKVIKSGNASFEGNDYELTHQYKEVEPPAKVLPPNDPNHLAHDPVDEQEQKLRDMAKSMMMSARQETAVMKAEAMEEVKLEREKILAQAKLQGEEIRASAAEQGCNDGMNSALADMAAQLEIWNQAIDSLATEQEQRLEQLERQVAMLALEVTEKILCQCIEADGTVLLPMVKAAISNVDSRQSITVTLSRTMPELIEQIRLQLGERGNLNVRAVDMAASGCHIETVGEIIDASVMTQLNNLREQLSKLAL